MATTDLLAHRKGDVVAIAVADLEPGSSGVRYLDESPGGTVEVREKVPLGHKVALTDIASGADVTEYGVRIGLATTAISAGDHVHVHNLKGVRWA